MAAFFRLGGVLVALNMATRFVMQIARPVAAVPGVPAEEGAEDREQDEEDQGVEHGPSSRECGFSGRPAVGVGAGGAAGAVRPVAAVPGVPAEEGAEDGEQDEEDQEVEHDSLRGEWFFSGHFPYFRPMACLLRANPAKWPL
jgi:hypothetical protein